MKVNPNTHGFELQAENNLEKEKLAEWSSGGGMFDSCGAFGESQIGYLGFSPHKRTKPHFVPPPCIVEGRDLFIMATNNPRDDDLVKKCIVDRLRIGLDSYTVPIAPVEGKNAAVSTEGNVLESYLPGYGLDAYLRAEAAAAQRNGPFDGPTCKPLVVEFAKTVPLPVVGRCKDCVSWSGQRNCTNGQTPVVCCPPEFGCIKFEPKAGV